MGGQEDSLKGIKLNLAALLDYQDGSVVSRQIVKGNTWNVTIFAFDAGEGLSEHTAPFDALVHVLDGAAEVVIADKKLTLEAGESAIMPANVPHALNAPGRFKMMLVMIKS